MKLGPATVKRSDIKVGERFRKDYGDLSEMVESIKEKGLIQSLSVDENLNLLAGGRRYKAAEQANLEDLPVIVRHIEGSLDAREIELMENIHRKDMAWQEKAALITEIDRLYKQKFGADTKGGGDPTTKQAWSGSKTAKLLNKSKASVGNALRIMEAAEAIPELLECKTEDDARKKLKKIQESIIVNELRKEQIEAVESGGADHIKYAESHYRVGDALEGLRELAKVQKEMGSPTPIKLVEIDPPYGIELNDVKKGDSKHEEYDEIPPEEYEDFLEELCSLVYKTTPKDVWVVFWYGPTWHTEVLAALRGAGFLVDDIPAIWAKGTGQTNAPDVYLARAYEPFFIARKGSPILHKRGRQNVFTYTPMSSAKKFHPTQRPVELMDEILRTFAYPGAIIMVPFLGSGVTLRSAYRNDMTGFGWDLSQKNKDRFLLSLEDDE